jgi:hypothetical protein
MKIFKITAVLLVMCVVLAACNSENSEQSDTKPSLTTVRQTAVTAVRNAGLSGYTFEFSDNGDNYIITASVAENELIFTVEDRNIEVSTCIDSIPEGYSPGALSAANCFILPMRFAGDSQKELLEIIFTPVDEDTPQTELVSKIYGIKNGVFMPLDVYDNTMLSMTYMETLPDTELIPTETNKFMTPPQVFYSDTTPSAIVTISTYTFDPNTMTFTKANEKTTPDNALYYGYAAYAAATDLYSFFTDRTLTIDTDGEFALFSNNVTGESDYYLPVEDPRFSTLAEFEAYIRNFFSEEIAAEMFRQAPQKYRDIGGVLHTLQVNNTRDPSLGRVILTDMLEEDVSILFLTEQFRTTDGVKSLEPGTDFILDTTLSPRWKAVSYKYPYK